MTRCNLIYIHNIIHNFDFILCSHDINVILKHRIHLNKYYEFNIINTIIIK